MTYPGESKAATERSRGAWPMAVVAIVVLVAIAVVAVLAFQGLNLLRTSSGAEADTGNGEAGSPGPMATPEATPIMPSLFAPPDRLLAGAG